MKKSIISFVASLAVFSVAVTFSIPAQSAQAQVVNCPSGYTCTPATSQPTGCPVGYTCTPTTSTSPTSRPTGIGYAGISGGGYFNANNCFDHTFSTNLSLGSTGSDVSALQTFLISKGWVIRNISTGLTAKGYFGSQTSAALMHYQASVGLSQTGMLDAVTRSTINSNACNSNGNPRLPTTTTSTSSQIPISNGRISLLTDTSQSNAVSGSYQVNLSFTGGTATQPVSSWTLTIQCPTAMDVNTVPGASCNDPFQMGTNGQNYGNVLSKAFWFKNNSGSAQTVTATLQGYTSSNVLIGSSQQSIQIPSTGSGPISDSAITLITPNGGQTYQAGQTIPIQWTTSTIPTGGYVRVMLLQGNANQLLIDNLPNTGSANMTLPTTAGGNNYYMEVQYISSTISSGDRSDEPFTIQPIIQNPTQPTCPSGQTWSGSMCTVQVQPNSASPFVSIISPNGGETYTAGQIIPISFSTNLTSQQNPNGFNIWAYYGGNSTDVGSYASGVQNIAMNWTSSSPYNWTVPSTWATGNYVIYIVPATLASGVSNTGLFAFGNSYFTITNGATSQTPTCSSGQTWNGSACMTTTTQSASPMITSVSVDKSTYNIGDSYTVTWNLSNAPTGGHIGIALENQNGNRVYNIVNTCDYVSDCANISAVSGPGTYTGTIPAGVGSIGPSVSNGQYKFEVELIANGAFVTDGVGSQTVSIPLQ